MRSFIADLQSLPEKLDNQLQRGERDEVRRELHTLKGVAATVGVTALAKLAGEAEAQFTSLSPAAEQAACVARVGTAIHRAALSLALLCAALNGDPKLALDGAGPAVAAALTPADTALLAGLLRTVQGLLQASDLDAADALQDPAYPVARGGGGTVRRAGSRRRVARIRIRPVALRRVAAGV